MTLHILWVLSIISSYIAGEASHTRQPYSLHGRTVDLKTCKMDFGGKEFLVGHSELAFLSAEPAIDPI